MPCVSFKRAGIPRETVQHSVADPLERAGHVSAGNQGLGRTAPLHGFHDAALCGLCACAFRAYGLRQNKLNDMTLSGAVTASAMMRPQVQYIGFGSDASSIMHIMSASSQSKTELWHVQVNELRALHGIICPLGSNTWLTIDSAVHEVASMIELWGLCDSWLTGRR